jgi:hypothetical protein
VGREFKATGRRSGGGCCPLWSGDLVNGSFDVLSNFATAIFAEMFENFSHSRPCNLLSSTHALYLRCENLGTRIVTILEGYEDCV